MDKREEESGNVQDGISGAVWVQIANRRTEQEADGESGTSEETLNDRTDWERLRRLRARNENRRRRNRNRHLLALIIGMSALTVLALLLAVPLLKDKPESQPALSPTMAVTSVTPVLSTAPVTETPTEAPYEITVQEAFLTPNEYSRPGLPIEEVNGIVIHYVGNPGTEAISNRNFFESLKDNHETSVSSHFVIGLRGEIIWCVPLNEVAYANRGRNSDTISIECCHPDEDGKFNEDTYESVVALAAHLVTVYGLEEEDILRHYDVTGKECPRYYVKNEEAWEQLKQDILEEARKHPFSVLVTE